MGVFIENTLSQSIKENAENKDIQTGFYNNFYLYSSARQALSQSETSAIVMFYLKDLALINEKFGRNIGDVLLIKTSKIIKESLEKDSMHIRYSGIRFLTVRPNTDAEAIHSTVERVLTRIKNEVEYVDEKQVTPNVQILIHTFRKQNNIEKEVQKMISYMDSMDQLNSIKII
jgi:diguanylate cyclase (GGDEF)-like protein